MRDTTQMSIIRAKFNDAVKHADRNPKLFLKALDEFIEGMEEIINEQGLIFSRIGLWKLKFWRGAYRWLI